jgi:glycogen synthase
VTRRGSAVSFHELRFSPQRRVVFVEAGSYFDRPGLYGERGVDYPDSAQRFAAFSEAALDFAVQPTDFPPIDIVHAHDWQTGLIPASLRHQSRWPSLDRAAVVYTVHNFAYQGVFPRKPCRPGFALVDVHARVGRVLGKIQLPQGWADRLRFCDYGESDIRGRDSHHGCRRRTRGRARSASAAVMSAS